MVRLGLLGRDSAPPRVAIRTRLLLGPLLAFALYPAGESAAQDRLALGPTASELALAKRVIPTLDSDDVPPSTRTVFGGSALPRPSAGASWRLLRVDTYPERPALHAESADSVAAEWAVVWFATSSESDTPRGFRCPDCEMTGVVALFDAETGDVVAVSSKRVAVKGRESCRPTAPTKTGRTTLYPLECTTRSKGDQSQRVRVFSRTKRKLVALGTVPVYASNEGRCGKVEDVVAKDDPIGRLKYCRHVYRFDARLQFKGGRIDAKERLVEAKKKKRRRARFKSKTSRKRIKYRVRKSALKASGRSLAKPLM